MRESGEVLGSDYCHFFDDNPDLTQIQLRTLYNEKKRMGHVLQGLRAGVRSAAPREQPQPPRMCAS